MVRWGRCFLLFCLLVAFLAVTGCEGTDTREKMDDAVEEMAGKKDLERYQQMKDDLKKIQKQQEERYRSLDQEKPKP